MFPVCTRTTRISSMGTHCRGDLFIYSAGPPTGAPPVGTPASKASQPPETICCRRDGASGRRGGGAPRWCWATQQVLVLVVVCNERWCCSSGPLRSIKKPHHSIKDTRKHEPVTTYGGPYLPHPHPRVSGRLISTSILLCFIGALIGGVMLIRRG